MRFSGVPRPVGTNADALLLGALLVIVPLALGWIMGWALRPLVQRRGGRYRQAMSMLFALVPLAIALPVAGAIPAIGSWDVLMGFAWIGVAMLLSLRYVAGHSSRAAILLIPLITLAILEILSRLGLAPVPPYPPARDARLVVSISARDPPCEAIFSDATGFIDQRSSEAGDKPLRVVHVGDSMVWGNGVRHDQAFPAQLGQLQPEVAHVNSGVPGAEPGSELLVAREWIERAHVDLTAVYFFMGNDMGEIERVYPCCRMGPLFDWSGGELQPRCERLSWKFPVGVLLSGSPPPYPLRVAAGYSSFAAHATAAFDGLNRWILAQRLFGVDFAAQTDAASPEERYAKLEQILRALRDDFRRRQARLVLVVLPFRATLERANGLEPPGVDPWRTLAEGRGAHQRVVDLARGLGIDTIDAWNPLAQAIAGSGAAAPWFAHAYPGDVHFSAAGHALLAKWLAPQIAQRLADVRRAPPPRGAGSGGNGQVAGAVSGQ